MTFKDHFNTKKVLQEKKKRKKKKKRSSKYHGWGYGYPGMYDGVAAAGEGGSE
jgi:hypothetical protein